MKKHSHDMTLRLYEPFMIVLLRVLDAILGPLLLYLIGFSLRLMPPYMWEAALVLFCLILITMNYVGIYRSWRFSSIHRELSSIMLACATVYFILLFILYFFSISKWYSRTLLLCWMVSWPIVLSLERILLRVVLRNLRKNGKNIKTAIIVGANPVGKRLAGLIRENPWSGTNMLGFFDDNMGPGNGFKMLGRLEQIESFISSHHVDTVYLALPMKEQSKVNDVLKRLKDTMVSVFLIPDFFYIDLMIGGYLTYFENMPVIALRESPLIGFNGLIKRFFDIVFSLLALILLSPLFLVIAIVIHFTSDGPVIFRQWRYGLNGQPIQVYKFRTMTVCEDGYFFCQAQKHDARITKFGAFLRNNSLDELPQLFNVLQGSMSLIGPRPHPAAMNEQYRKLLPGYMLRHKVKPGITGLAQLHGYRGETDTIHKIRKRLEYDLEYIRTWSLWNDIVILVQTIVTGAWRTNAY
ncbi:undecaprenyl-phosphate glucose phosphotransferase [Desulfatirhabdium butyrativorans]|uniref:undecaprenyl-phosphate glucose phosphotransferase n=1 Tax=Desulfatirhabdium butyrativorans TaxID=340467 RepID=UPI000480A4E9|nr:undecaprenyl-phosphate glucose phosphotransferase [Desulfatirhabdium butyrativorans]